MRKLIALSLSTPYMDVNDRRGMIRAIDCEREPSRQEMAKVPQRSIGYVPT